MTNAKLRALSASTRRASSGPRNKSIHCLNYKSPGTDGHRSPETSERLLVEVLDRLRRLEEQVGLATGPVTEDNEHPSAPSVVDSGALRSGDALPRVTPCVVRDMIRGMHDMDTRSVLLFDIFCPLRQIDSCFFDNPHCLRAFRSAISEIETAPTTQTIELPDQIIPKDLAKKLIESESSPRPLQYVI